jgi:hypothetical protein
VLASWQEGCAAREHVDVGPMRTVSVATGAGQAYRVGRGTRATDLGILRKGAFLSVVVLIAPSADLPAHSAAARAAVRRIAATY